MKTTPSHAPAAGDYIHVPAWHVSGLVLRVERSVIRGGAWDVLLETEPGSLAPKCYRLLPGEFAIEDLSVRYGPFLPSASAETV